MRKPLVGALLAGAMVVSACEPGNEDLVAGALVGGALGTITAAALSNNAAWIVAGGLAGAAAGTLVATSVRGDTCAYARGDGTYYTARC